MDNGVTTCALMLAFMLAIGVTAVDAQQTVYRWVDDEGVEHFSDAPPDDATGVESTTIVTSPPAPAAAPAPSAAAQPAKSSPEPAVQPQPAVVAPKTDISAMSLGELDARCDAAREVKIAPKRTAEIEKCKAEKRSDPDWCERFNADFGEGGRNINGSMRPRMFDDLPECVDAQNERNRRPR